MEKPILADSSLILPTADPPLEASEMTGTVYVIDLIGFSAVTEAQIRADARSGTEDVSRLVANIFGRLMTELASRNIHFGGLAGDALVAWQRPLEGDLSETELYAIASQSCEAVSAGLSCKTAKAKGRFWSGGFRSNRGHHPLIWGDAVSQAFAKLSRHSTTRAQEMTPLETASPAKIPDLAVASVADRWTVVMRVVSSAASGDVTPSLLSEMLARTNEICAAHSAKVDNLVQDDKGLLFVIVLPLSLRSEKDGRDALVNLLTTGRAPLAQATNIASDFGTVFRFTPHIAHQLVQITIGQPINAAAKALQHRTRQALNVRSDVRSSAETSTNASPMLIGRETECVTLRGAFEQSLMRRHIAAVIGPAGIGKTRLFQSLRQDIRNTGVVVDVTPGSRYLPFGCAQDLAEVLGLPAHTVFDAAGQTELAKRLPSLVVIENWQWCDDDSRRLIRRLQTDRPVGLLLVSSRTDISDLVIDTEMRLSALDQKASYALIEQLAPNCFDDELRRSVYELTSGTPFWLVQAAHHFSDGLSVENVTGLERLLSARAQTLTPSAIALWRMHCAWRWPLSFERASNILSKFDIQISPTHLRELQNLGWLSPDGDGYRPAHDILADWGLADLPITFERNLHSTIARSLSKTNGSPARIARHWQIADYQLRAAVWYKRASHRADHAGSHRLTLTHLDQFERLSGASSKNKPLRELDRLALSATANWGVGKLRRAKQVLARFDSVAKTVPNSSQKRDALQRAATIQSEVGQFAGNANLILTGIYRGWRNGGDVAGAYEIKSRRQGFIYYTLGLLRLPVDGRLERLVAKAHARGEYRSEALLGCAAATLHIKRCEWEKAEAILTSCFNAIAQTDDRQMLGVVQCLLGLNALFQGDADTAHFWFENVTDIGRDQDHHMFRVWGAYAKAEALFYANNLDAAKTQALDARTMAKGLGDHQSVCIIEGVLAQLYIKESAPEPAFKHARNAMRFAAKLPPSNFSTLEGIAAPAQIGCALVEAQYRVQESARLMSAGCKALNTYAQVFKMARPRKYYVDGLIARQNGKLRAARHKFQKAIAASESFGMQREHALASAALIEIEES